MVHTHFLEILDFRSYLNKVLLISDKEKPYLIPLQSIESIQIHSILQLLLIITYPMILRFDFSVYDLKGAIVDRLFKGKMVSGYHQIEWIPKNISSGIYLINFELKGTTINRKITFLK